MLHLVCSIQWTKTTAFIALTGPYVAILIDLRAPSMVLNWNLIPLIDYHCGHCGRIQHLLLSRISVPISP